MVGSMDNTLARIIGSLTLVAGVLAGPVIVSGPVVSVASASPAVYGDDNGDGIVDEDESGWDCTTMGNMLCGERDEMGR